MTQDFWSALGLRWPLLQAPMAGVQGSALAVAVSRAGGLGALPAAMLTPDALRAELAVLHDTLTPLGLPYNVNFFCHRPPVPDVATEAQWLATLAPYYAELGVTPPQGPAQATRAPFGHAAADVLEPFRPPVVSFHFGLPEPAVLARVKAWGSRVLSSATTVDEARWLQAHGADAIIVQGLEAGGHRGVFLDGDLATQSGLFALLPQVARAVEVPVIAAGGIADASGVAAALALGANAVQAGTAFLLCPEATTSPLHRAALAQASTRPTALTHVFTGRPARGLVNRAMRELVSANGGPHPAVPAFPLAGWAMGPLRAPSEALGRDDFTPLWAGQHAAACRAEPAAAVVHRLAQAWGPGARS